MWVFYLLCALFVLYGAYAAWSSYALNRACQKRERDFDRCLDAIRSGDFEKAHALTKKHAEDPEFMRCSSAARRVAVLLRDSSDSDCESEDSEEALATSDYSFGSRESVRRRR